MYILGFLKDIPRVRFFLKLTTCEFNFPHVFAEVVVFANVNTVGKTIESLTDSSERDET